jgi:SAM-dependent methyltransferase
MNRYVRRLADAVRRIPGGAWILGWTDPLHLAQRSLYRAIKQRTHYAQGRLLDLGCGVKPYRELFSHVSQYVGLEIDTGPDVDVSGDAQVLPFADSCFDTVLCNEVLEHVPEPASVMAEVKRVLTSGGFLLLTTPQTWGLHHEPHDYYRYTRYGLRYLAEKAGLQVIDIVPTCGVWSTVAQRLVDTIVHDYGAKWPAVVVRLLSVALGPVLFMGAGLDRLGRHRGDTLDNVLVAKKP